MHGGGPPVTAGTPLAPEYKEENVELVKGGMSNLARHIRNTAQYGVPVIVAINKFASDTQAELDAVREASLEAGGAPFSMQMALQDMPWFPIRLVGSQIMGLRIVCVIWQDHWPEGSFRVDFVI